MGWYQVLPFRDDSCELLGPREYWRRASCQVQFYVAKTIWVLNNTGNRTFGLFAPHGTPD